MHRAAGAAALRFTAWIECAACGCDVEGDFVDDTGSTSVEDITDPPVGRHTCPCCGREWESAYPGWTFYSEAG